MQIAQIAPLTEAIPPKLYGGTERVISWLADELVALGHDVVLFASGDSETAANLEAFWQRALRLDGSVRDPNALHMAMLEQVRQRAHDFDLLHFHLDYYPFSLFSRQPTPFVTTLHGRLDLPEHQVVFATFPSIPVISISDAQRRPVPRAGWIRTIYHGLPERLLTPQPVKPTYFAFLGRISPEKAVDQAIWIAERAGVPLKIAAKVDAVDRDYFESKIRKLLTPPHVEYIGEISDGEKSSFLSGAIALLAPIAWPEPFGLVLIEAMACGTPVIAFNRGSVPEIVEDGLTGFIVEGKEKAVDASDNLSRLSRGTIRQRFEERFTARRMAREYLNVYRNLIEKRPYRQWPRQSVRTDTKSRALSSRVLQEVIRQAPAEYVTVGWLTSTLRRHSFGIIMLSLGLLATTPVGSTVPGFILAVMAVQLILGRDEPVFPRFITTRRLPTKQLLRLGGRGIHVLKYLEKAVHPRWPVTFEAAKRAVGIMILLLTVVLLLTPVPLSNVAPAMVISLISLAYVEEDGLLLSAAFLAGFVLIGIGLAAVWGTIVGAVLISA
jgi:glycosyltransferase involved in cell wall biosynthesis